jgi:hypothetical protein
MSKKTDKTLEKCDELIDRLMQLKKALNVTNVSSNRTPVNALGAGWSQDPGTGAFHHSGHGVISTTKHPEGHYQITHGGRSVGRAATPAEAGAHIKNYVRTLKPGDTGAHNVDPMSLGKEEGVDKSDYGKFKGGSQYDPAANVRRKATNVGAERFGNQSVKSYTHGKAFAQKTPKGAAGPVKQFTPEQVAAINEARKLKKTAENAPWVTHNSVPNADYEVERLQKENPAIAGEDAMATQLAAMMQSKAMMRPDHRQPSSEEMVMAGQAMGLAPSEEMIKAADRQWHGTMNNWLLEASKPISQRFASEEEELAYWSSIKVNGGSGGSDFGF